MRTAAGSVGPPVGSAFERSQRLHCPYVCVNVHVHVCMRVCSMYV